MTIAYQKEETKAEDAQSAIGQLSSTVPAEVWEALEAVKPFAESQRRKRRTESQTTTSGTGGVRLR
jgi:hypothetical protein